MTIELERTIDASPDAVFRALTDADELPRWWTTSAETRPRQTCPGARPLDMCFWD